jgi:two-component system LytT family sensor kinase
MSHHRATAARNPFSRSRRIAFVCVASVVVSCMPAVALLGARVSVPRGLAILGYYAGLGLAWGMLAVAVGAVVASIEQRQSSAALRFATYAGALLACAVVDMLAKRFGSWLLDGRSVIPWYGTLLYFADFTLVSFAAIVFLARSLIAHDRFVLRRRRSLALEAQVARARLASLEEQLHPHFLFNSLGAVIELAHEAPAVASRLLRQLASVIRFAVEREGPEVSVAAEFAALEPYLDVHRTRFADWLTVETEVAPDAAELRVPPLVLQPLVENAVRHGLARRNAPGHIRIAATVRSGALTITVHDNGIGLRGTDSAGRGLGLTNLNERLSALYDGAATLSLFDDESGGAVSQVTMPAHRADTAAHTFDDTGEDGEPTPLVPGWIRHRPAVAIVLGWVTWGLIYTQQSIAYLAFRDRLAGRTFLGIAAHDFATAMLWAPFTPVMLVALRLIPIRPPHLAARLGAHGLAAITVAVCHSYLVYLITGDPFASLSESGMSLVAWGMIAYAVVIGLGYQREISDWMRERELADSRLRLRMAEVKLQVNTTRTNPRQLVESLEAIARSIAEDAARAERDLVQLSDDLRQTLAMGAAA